MDKLIDLKYEPGNKNLCPRWAYDDGDFIVKVIPFVSPPDANIKNQIDLINSLHPVKLIQDDFEIYENPKHPWFFNNGDRSTTFLKYKMTKVPYVYQLDENISYRDSMKRLLTPIYTDIDLYNEYILSKYIEVNLKIFPHLNADGGNGNILQYDIGDWIIVDWDDCILGNEHSSQEIGETLISETVDGRCRMEKFGGNLNTIIEMCNKTFDFYKKLTYNTVLEDCVVDIEKMAIKTQQKNKAKYEGTWKNR